MMKRFLAVLLIAITILSGITPCYAAGHQDDDEDEYRYMAEEYKPKFFVAYIYGEDNPDNPYNNTYRDYTITFGGHYNIRYTKKQYNYVSSNTYKDFKVVKIIGYLPWDYEEPYGVMLTGSDGRAGKESAVCVNGLTGTYITAMDTYIPSDYNEFFFVYGSKDYIKSKEANTILTNMAQLFHSETDSMNDTLAAEKFFLEKALPIMEKDANEHPDYSEWTIEGKTYTREDLAALGANIEGIDNSETATGEAVSYWASAAGKNYDITKPDNGKANNVQINMPIEVPEEPVEDTNEEEVENVPEKDKPLDVIIFAVIVGIWAKVKIKDLLKEFKVKKNE